MAKFISGIIKLKCPSGEYIARYNDEPQSGLKDEIERIEFITVIN
jgi:hypothetical protein